MSTGDTQPTQPMPATDGRRRAAPAPPPGAWPWIVACAIVIGLAVAAWFAGEAIARGPRRPRRSASRSSRSSRCRPTSEVDVDRAGVADAPAADLAGTLDEVDDHLGRRPMEVVRRATSTVHAQDIPIRGVPRESGAARRRRSSDRRGQLRQRLIADRGLRGRPLDLGDDAVAYRVDRALLFGDPAPRRRHADASRGRATPRPHPGGAAARRRRDLARRSRARSAGSPTVCATGRSASPSTSRRASTLTGVDGRRRRGRRRLRHRRRDRLRPAPRRGERSRPRGAFVTRMTRGSEPHARVP